MPQADEVHKNTGWLVPKAARMDAGDIAKHVGTNAQAFQRGLEPLVDFL